MAITVETSNSGTTISFGTCSCNSGKTKREFKGKSLVALPSDYIVIDTETTGLDYNFCELIEVSAIHYSDGKAQETFSSLVKPLNPVDDDITELTGITNDMLLTAPPAADIIPKFCAFLGNSILIGHNVNFDINFLYDAAKRCGLKFSNDFIDTLRLSKKVFPSLDHHRLSDLSLACQVTQVQAHRAEADCMTTAQCYEAMRSLILSCQTEEQFQKLFEKNYSKSLESVHATADAIDDSNPLFGKTVVFTGALSSMQRKDAFQIVVNLGGEAKNSITKKTNYLVIGNEDFAASVKDGKTDKMKKAEAYRQAGQDICIISEDAFFDMIEDYICPPSETGSSEQLAFLPSVFSESTVYDILKSSLADVISANNVSLDRLIFKEGKAYSSVWYDSQLAFRICCRDGHHYFGLSDNYAKAADPKFSHYVTSDGRSEGYCNFKFTPNPEGVMFYRSLLTAALDSAVDAFPKEFDCCSRYEKCSEAKKCVNPNPDIATACGYRKIMKSGRIFYGKNRNV